MPPDTDERRALEPAVPTPEHPAKSLKSFTHERNTMVRPDGAPAVVLKLAVSAASALELAAALGGLSVLLEGGFDCPRCHSLAYLVGGWRWRCEGCGAHSTRFELERRVLEDPAALDRLLSEPAEPMP
jgi:hypothetical protein